MKKMSVSLLVIIMLSSIAFCYDFVNCKEVNSSGICMDIPSPVIKVKDDKGRTIFESKCELFNADGKSCKKWEYLRDYTYEGDNFIKKGYGRFITREGYFQDYVTENFVYDYTTSKQCVGAKADGTCIAFGDKYKTGVMLNIHFKNQEGSSEHRYCEEKNVRPDGTCVAYQGGTIANTANRPEAYRSCSEFDENGKNCIKYAGIDFIKRDSVNNKSAQLQCAPETISADGNSCTKYEMSWWDYSYTEPKYMSRATAFKFCNKGDKIEKDGSCKNYKCAIYKYENNVQRSETVDCSIAEPLIKEYKSKLSKVAAKI